MVDLETCGEVCCKSRRKLHFVANMLAATPQRRLAGENVRTFSGTEQPPMTGYRAKDPRNGKAAAQFQSIYLI